MVGREGMAWYKKRIEILEVWYQPWKLIIIIMMLLYYKLFFLRKA